MPLTQSPFRVTTLLVHLSSRSTRHLVETFNRILRATRRIQGVTQTLPNLDVEIIKFPSGYLTESMSDLDTAQYTH